MQTKFKFDKISVIKMLKGALIAATGAAALYILKWLGSIEVGNWTPIIAAAVPALVNIIKEWLKGDGADKAKVLVGHSAIIESQGG